MNMVEFERSFWKLLRRFARRRVRPRLSRMKRGSGSKAAKRAAQRDAE